MADPTDSRRDVVALREYVDAKFETIVNAANTAQRLALETAAKAEEQNKRFAERREVDNFAGKIDALAEHQTQFLTLSDYNIRHESLQQKLDDRLKTPWTTYISFGMMLLVIVGGFWGLAYGPIQTRFGELDARDSEQRAAVAALTRKLDTAYVPRVEQQAILRGEENKWVTQSEFNKLVEAENITKGEFAAVEKRFDEKNHTQDARVGMLMTKDAFDGWKTERDKLIGQLEARIEKLYNIIDAQNEKISEISGKLKAQGSK